MRRRRSSRHAHPSTWPLVEGPLPVAVGGRVLLTALDRRRGAVGAFTAGAGGAWVVELDGVVSPFEPGDRVRLLSPLESVLVVANADVTGVRGDRVELLATGRWRVVQRRSEVREPRCVEVGVRRVHPAGPAESVLTRDVSGGGVCVEAHVELRVGDRVTIERGGPIGGVEEHCPGEVVAVTTTPDGGRLAHVRLVGRAGPATPAAPGAGLVPPGVWLFGWRERGTPTRAGWI